VHILKSATICNNDKDNRQLFLSGHGDKYEHIFYDISFESPPLFNHYEDNDVEGLEGEHRGLHEHFLMPVSLPYIEQQIKQPFDSEQ
jgi:hypothetical protein